MPRTGGQRGCGMTEQVPSRLRSRRRSMRRTDPTDRSIPPLISTSVIPIDTTVRAGNWLSSVVKRRQREESSRRPRRRRSTTASNERKMRFSSTNAVHPATRLRNPARFLASSQCVDDGRSDACPACRDIFAESRRGGFPAGSNRAPAETRRPGLAFGQRRGFGRKGCCNSSNSLDTATIVTGRRIAQADKLLVDREFRRPRRRPGWVHRAAA